MIENTIIAVFCYKRAAKLKTSMEALLKNPECSGMDIVFFCDGHKGDKDFQGVKETRAYIDSLTGFKNIYKHYREKNLSTGPNFKMGITWLCENYDQFIVVEDDLVVTSNYITYLLQGLQFYKQEQSVFCVTGFCFPINVKNYAYDTIVHKRFCSYGWASWSNRVKNVKWDKDELKNIIKTTPGFKNSLNEEGRDLYRMVKKQIDGTISTWDIQMQVHVSLNRYKVIYPIVSKAYNIGFDNESTNTFGVDYLKTTLDDGSKTNFNFCPVHVVEPALQDKLKQPYSLPALAYRKVVNTIIKYTSKIRRPALTLLWL
ncbi:hypothetical protein [Segetibacter aerophilus]|uniref:Hemolytic protein HlpA n=1 Tax=Segetibacter aerophilus TaxID=670293 RepID=A0A512BIE2_9BACT|nr:hypothetical protein [Segetibacter aerophilus]GEO11748.1 hemolytic protein HlpA [Segetibacter aerophilus]